VFRLGRRKYILKKTQIFEESRKTNKLKVGSISAMNAINRLEKPSYFIPRPMDGYKK
jgi:hypothetical protein